MSIATWKELSVLVKFVKYNIDRNLGEQLQDLLDDLYDLAE